MSTRTYTVVSRPSLLAMTQTKQTLDHLKTLNPGVEFEIVPLSTHGDKIVDKPLVSFGGTGLFVKELEQALLDGKAHIAIHSLKDMPSAQPTGLTLAAFAQREDARDVLLLNNDSSRTLLGIGSVIGTGSPRRQLQLKKLFPGASFKDLRGNIDTRLRKLRDGEYDAIVLAAAGLRRLSIPVEPGSLLSLEECIPAVGQGALALQCRADDVPTITVLKTINHLDTERAITAERSFMQTIGGGCKFPLAAHAVVTGSHVTMRCIIGDLSSYHSQHLTRSFALADVVEAGQDMAHTLRRMCLDNGIIV